MGGFRCSRLLKTSMLAVGLAVLAILVLIPINLVSKRLTTDDKKAIAVFDVGHVCANMSTFQEQVRCIEAAQASIHAIVPDTTCARRGQTVEPLEFLNRGHGCCTDRARTLEKIFTYYGLEVRRVALYDTSKYGLLTFAIPGTDSHASLEVRTIEGWMGVDSNYPFILWDENIGPFTYTKLVESGAQLGDSVIPRVFYARRPTVIYGFYSRHGLFHGWNIPGPEIHLGDFFRYNF